MVSSVLDICSIHKSWMDISFMFEENGSVIAFIEAKSKEPSTSTIRQTVAYSVCPLAFCRWGRWRNKEPLVSLLMSPQMLYRLTFTKSSVSAFGIELKIEKTDNKVQMEFELNRYVKKYIEDFHKAETANFIDDDSVNPLDWTAMNLKMEDLPPLRTNPVKWHKPLMSKNGFLFRTSSDAVKNLEAKYGLTTEFSGLAAGIPVFVKYLSAVLDSNFEHCVTSLNTLLSYSEAERRHLADLAAVKNDLAAVKKRYKQRNERHKQRIERYRPFKKRYLELLGKAPAVEDDESNLSEAEEETHGGTEKVVESDTQPATTTMSYVADVVHSYLGILILTAGHPMVIMHDAGESLYDLVYCPGSTYRLEWQQSHEWRAAFLTQIGLSALNLVDKVKLCHNDIRLPNIAVRNGRFCLLDFDFSSASVTFQPKSAFSPPLKLVSTSWRPREMAMCYSVAQIAVNVFLLGSSTQFSFGEVTAAESIWSEVRDVGSPVDRQFQAWVDEKGGLLPGFVSAVRAACAPRRANGAELARRFPENFRQYFEDVLRRMLVE